MGNNNSTFSIIPLSWILFSSLAYFVYGGLNGVFAVFILLCIFSVLLLFNIIPFFGVVVQVVCMYFITIWVYGFTGVSGSWLTNLIWAFYIICGIIINIVCFVFLWGRLK